MFQITFSDDGVVGKLETVCSFCGEPLDKKKAVRVSEITGEDMPEVVRYATPFHRSHGGDLRYYHGACWVKENEQMADPDPE